MIRHPWFTMIVLGLTCLGPPIMAQQVETRPETPAPSDITPQARAIAGMVLCQNALAKHILVIGDDQGLIHTLLLSKAVESVTWARTEAEPLSTQPLPVEDTDPRLILHTGTVESLLETHTKTYDIILVNDPKPTRQIIRDTLSPEFQTLIQQALTPTGLAAFRLPGSNTHPLPPHLAFLGATLYQQLYHQFLQVLLVPGEPLFFLCSNINYMTTYAPRLEARFSLLDQAEAILPRDYLGDMYDPERAARIKAQFETVDSNIPFSGSLYTLLDAADRLHLNLLPYLKPIRQVGPWYLGIPILIAAFLRLLYVVTYCPRKKTQACMAPAEPAAWDARLLTRCSGILLWSTGHLLVYTAIHLPWSWGSLIPSLGLVVSLLLLWHTRLWFAAQSLKYPTLALGLGLIQGLFLTGILLIPLFDMADTLRTLSLFIPALLSLFVAHRIRTARPGPLVINHTLFTPAGYALFWIGLSLIVVIHTLAYINRPSLESPLIRSVPQWTDGLRVTPKNLAVSDTAPPVPYQEVWTNRQLTGYIFQTRDFTGTVYGYGGPIGLILFITPDGTLLDFRFTQSYETPRYIWRIGGWLDALKGHAIFGPTPLQDVYAVSGATLSTRAIMRLMRDSGQQFAAQVLAQGALPTANHRIMALFTQKGFLLLLTGLALAFMAILHGKLWSRIAVLLYTAGVFGVWLNKQYSTDHIMRVLEWNHVFSGTPEFLALLIGVPILILLFGNLYCGYLCPFGALQELICFLIPKRFKPRLSHSTVQGARFIKYGVLFALVLSMFAFKNKDSLQIDPLTSFFNRQLWPDLMLTPLWLFLGIGILLVTRFWCRYLCPTGAFLSLLNRCAWLQRWLPAKKYGRCEFDLTGRDNLDCIYCDRCNYKNSLIPERTEAITRDKPNLISRLFLVWLLITASLLIWPLVHKDTPTADPNTPDVVVQSK